MRVGQALALATYCLAAAALAFAQSQSAPPPPPPELPIPSAQSAVRISVNLVMVDATVKTKNGQVISNLTKDDFEVLEDDVVQKLEVCSRDELPLNLAIVLDLSDSMDPFLQPLRDSMTNALGALKPEDQVALFTFSSHVQLRVFLTDDRARIARYISTSPAGGATNINDGLYAAAKYFFNEQPNGRRVIILISDDVGTSAGAERTPQIIAKSLEADAGVYNLTVPGYNPPEVIRGAHNIAGLVDIRKVLEETGGENFKVEDVEHVDEAFRDLIARIKTRYTLGYYAKSNKRSAKLHKLEVRLAPSFGKKGRDYVIVAKDGFYVR
jgi:Ca-activated chloride channel homolog